MAECNFKAGQYVSLSDTSILDRMPGLVNCLMKAAVEIELNIINFSGCGGFILSQLWCPVTNMLIKKQYAA
jgi:hypothetical protein